MRPFIDHIELWLSAAGLVVVWVATFFCAASDVNLWKITTFTAIGVSVIHGFIFWGVRYRQRRIRRQSILDIQVMLSDIIKNQLAVIGMLLPREENAPLEMIDASIKMISRQVDGLSEESLGTWRAQYEEHDEAIESDTPSFVR